MKNLTKSDKILLVGSFVSMRSILSWSEDNSMLLKEYTRHWNSNIALFQLKNRKGCTILSHNASETVLVVW